jgi:hypothetical protein
MQTRSIMPCFIKSFLPSKLSIQEGVKKSDLETYLLISGCPIQFIQSSNPDLDIRKSGLVWYLVYGMEFAVEFAVIIEADVRTERLS